MKRKRFEYKHGTLAGLLVVFVFSGLFAPSGLCRDVAYVTTPSTQGTVTVTSWKTMRDRQIVKQTLDYSCGAASLATLINEFYGQSISEADLLEKLEKDDGYISFEDMRLTLPAFGFRAAGYAASYNQLTRLKIPVLVYIRHRREDHFSVLRGVDDQTVWLADPSLGNRTYSRSQFLSMWETRDEKAENAALKGRILAVLPDEPDIGVVEGFFTRSPGRRSAAAVRQVLFRPAPWRPPAGQ